MKQQDNFTNIGNPDDAKKYLEKSETLDVSETRRLFLLNNLNQ